MRGERGAFLSVRFFGQHLLERGLLTPEQLLAAIVLQETRNHKIGVYAQRRGLLTQEQAEEIATRQRTEDRRFGEIAMELGYLTLAQIDELVTMQQNDHMYLGGAIVVLGFLDKEAIERELAVFKADQARYGMTELALPANAPFAQELSMLVALTQRLALRLCDAECKWGLGMPAPPPPAPRAWTVGIDISGAVSAVYSLSCGEPVARRLARALFRAEAMTLGVDMIHDAFGEFANLVCGNGVALWARQGRRAELGPPTDGLAPPLGEGYLFPLHFPEGVLDVRVL